MHFLHSSYREKLVEHLFVGELLRHLWCRRIVTVSVLRPEVDNAGYDIVLTHGGVIRHVQLKCSRAGTSAAGQNINSSLSAQPSGCVLWMVVDEELRFQHFRWFGGIPGQPLPPLEKYKKARHTKANSQGVKAVRPSIRMIPKSSFTQLPNMGAVIDALFGAPLEVQP